MNTASSSVLSTPEPSQGQSSLLWLAEAMALSGSIESVVYALCANDGLALNPNAPELVAERSRLREHLKQRVAVDTSQAVAAALAAASNLLEARVQWVPCDCGCPSQRSPKGAADNAYLRAAAAIRIFADDLRTGKSTLPVA